MQIQSIAKSLDQKLSIEKRSSLRTDNSIQINNSSIQAPLMDQISIKNIQIDIKKVNQFKSTIHKATNSIQTLRIPTISIKKLEILERAISQ